MSFAMSASHEAKSEQGGGGKRFHPPHLKRGELRLPVAIFERNSPLRFPESALLFVLPKNGGALVSTYCLKRGRHVEDDSLAS